MRALVNGIMKMGDTPHARGCERLCWQGRHSGARAAPIERGPMAHDFISLAIIALVAFLAPVIAQSIPRKPIPETVLLLALGAILGPNCLNYIWITEPISLLSELGLAFLFLLAGYEINPKMLMGTEGKKGLRTWVFTFVFALALVFVHPNLALGGIDAIPMAIVLTTTALGTLMPILRERELMDTKVGRAVIAYGTWGELGPVLAMAILLSTRTNWQTAAILGAFVALCVVAAALPAFARKNGTRLYKLLESKANTTSQTFVRGTIMILVALVAFSAIFDIDIVLGAFAAGFVLRYITPEGNVSLETKLDAIGFGFLIPLFFVVSGAKIDLSAIAADPAMLLRFVALLLAVRAAPIVISLSIGKTREQYTMHERISVALYSTTALPIIVAVTSLCVKNGTLDSSTASIMVAAGATTVFIMPLFAGLAYGVADRHPIDAVREIAHDPHHAGAIVSQHIHEHREHAHTDYHHVYMAKQRPDVVHISMKEHAKHAEEE